MEFIWILFAFVCGLVTKMFGLPALIGFLVAGFGLNLAGFQADSDLQALADLGITLMLFTIGLKLNIRDLIKPEVYAGAAIHSLAWSSLLVLCLLCMSWLGLSHFLQMDLKAAAVLAFALSFSSTVCIVKLLEDNGELKTRHGKLAIGVLVVQDVLAVFFMVFSTGELPSLYAIGLLLLPLFRPVLVKILGYSGHGELLPLTGFLFALGGYHLFELVGIKGDMGALVVGMLVAGQPKSNELAKSLLSFKDIFLIGFFLSVGLTALPDLSMLYSALFLCLLLPIKFILFFSIFISLKLRARTAYLAGLVLSNYSEFGLIVVAIAVSFGWLGSEWLIILALSLSFSFIATSLFYTSVHSSYQGLKDKLRTFENPIRLQEDIYAQPKEAKILVVGMGRVGKGAYHNLHALLGDKVWGMDADPERVRKQTKSGLKVILGDGEDAELWEYLDISSVELVLLALPSIEDITHISEQLRRVKYQGKIAAIARYEDEVQALLDAGSDKVFNYFTEAGSGFAEESLGLLGQSPK
ncbi:MAG: glutathione-regulated potassium-efflux system ancillary protein KefC [Paraglaciecola sp.]